MKESAEMYGIDKKIQFHHHVNGAAWSSSSKTWTMDITANGTEQKTIRSRFFMFCTGYYDYDKPLDSVIPGIESFKGTVAHPQFWPEDLDYTDKNVVVVGSGATAITIMPAMADKAAHITMLQRSPSYIMSQPSQDALEILIRKLTWWNKSLEHKLIRYKWVMIPFLLTRFCRYFPATAKKFVSKAMHAQLPPTLARDPHFNPTTTPSSSDSACARTGTFTRRSAPARAASRPASSRPSPRTPSSSPLARNSTRTSSSPPRASSSASPAV